jgi:hypothetical protein
MNKNNAHRFSLTRVLMAMMSVSFLPQFTASHSASQSESHLTFGKRRRAKKNPRPFVEPGLTRPTSGRESFLGREIDTYLLLAKHKKYSFPEGSQTIVMGALPEQLATIVAADSLVYSSKGKTPKRRTRRKQLEANRQRHTMISLNNAPNWFDGAVNSKTAHIPDLEKFIHAESRPIAPCDSTWRRMSRAFRKACGRIKVGDMNDWQKHIRMATDKPVILMLHNVFNYFERPGTASPTLDDAKIDVVLASLVEKLPSKSLVSIGRMDFLPDLRTDKRLLALGLRPIPMSTSPRGHVENLSVAKRCPGLFEPNQTFLFEKP